ncbi:transcription elongation factor 1 homolog isoform 2-T2 [Podargus strigoides]
MGRRKSKRKPPPKKKVTGTLETQFTCPFCNHEKSCDVKMGPSSHGDPGCVPPHGQTPALEVGLGEGVCPVPPECVPIPDA